MAYAPARETTKLVKVLLVGPSGVGKTAIRNRLSSDPFPPNHKPTIGADFGLMKKVLEEGDVKYKFQLWDSAGQERFRSANILFYRGSEIAIIAWDATSAKTPQALHAIFEKHLADIQGQTNPFPAIIFVRNKIDDKTTRGLTQKQEQEVIDELKLKKDKHTIVEVSAKTGAGFDRLEKEMLRLTVAQLKSEEQTVEPDVIESLVVADSTPPQRSSRRCGFFRNPPAQIGTGIAVGSLGLMLAVGSKPIATQIYLQLFAMAAPQAAVIGLLVLGLALLAAGTLLTIRGGIQQGGMRCSSRQNGGYALI